MIVVSASGLSFSGYTDGPNKEIVDGLLSSGDLGHFDAEGRLFIDGRDDDMIVSGGENVYPLEVENLLIDHPDILDAAVVGVDDHDFGKRLRAFGVRAPGAGTDADELRAHVKAHLARHKVPRDAVFVEELSRNATGKLLRRRLGQPALRPSPRRRPRARRHRARCRTVHRIEYQPGAAWASSPARSSIRGATICSGQPPPGVVTIPTATAALNSFRRRRPLWCGSDAQ